MVDVITSGQLLALQHGSPRCDGLFQGLGSWEGNGNEESQKLAALLDHSVASFFLRVQYQGNLLSNRTSHGSLFI